jgi:NTP pyrophosphatase (non-canonical NTP hydrolase)
MTTLDDIRARRQQGEAAITEALAAQREMRDARQARVAEWCAAAFGIDQASSVEQRGLRLLEEAIEAYQAAGCNREQAHKLVDYVFARPPGKLAQELGGVGITTLALANACGASADAEEARELERVLSKPLAHFAARNQVKNDAGFAAIRQQDKGEPG